MIRFIHTADWQLGMTRHFLSAEERGRYDEARLDAVRAIGRLAHDTQCNFVVVSGDVFESNQSDRQVVARALDAMDSFDIPVFLLPGNHDPLTAAGSVWDSPTFVSKCPKNVVVVRESEPIQVRGCDAEVVGAPWRTKRPLEDLVATAASKLHAGGPVRVLIGHGAVDEGIRDSDNPALIRLPDAERLVEVHQVQYIALGDRHSVTEVGKTGRIWYSGTPLVTDYNEVEPNQVLVVELDGGNVHVEAHRVGEWQFLEKQFAVNNDSDVDDVAEWLESLGPARRHCVVKLGFVGTVDLTTKAHLDEVLESQDLLAALETWDLRTDLVVLPSDTDFADLGLGGFVSTTVDELRSLAQGDGPGSTVAQDALGLLFRLARARS